MPVPDSLIMPPFTDITGYLVIVPLYLNPDTTLGGPAQPTSIVTPPTWSLNGSPVTPSLVALGTSMHAILYQFATPILATDVLTMSAGQGWALTSGSVGLGGTSAGGTGSAALTVVNNAGKTVESAYDLTPTMTLGQNVSPFANSNNAPGQPRANWASRLTSPSGWTGGTVLTFDPTTGLPATLSGEARGILFNNQGNGVDANGTFNTEGLYTLVYGDSSPGVNSSTHKLTVSLQAGASWNFTETVVSAGTWTGSAWTGITKTYHASYKGTGSYGLALALLIDSTAAGGAVAFPSKGNGQVELGVFPPSPTDRSVSSPTNWDPLAVDPEYLLKLAGSSCVRWMPDSAGFDFSGNSDMDAVADLAQRQVNDFLWTKQTTTTCNIIKVEPIPSSWDAIIPYVGTQSMSNENWYQGDIRSRALYLCTTDADHGLTPDVYLSIAGTVAAPNPVVVGTGVQLTVNLHGTPAYPTGARTFVVEEYNPAIPSTGGASVANPTIAATVNYTAPDCPVLTVSRPANQGSVPYEFQASVTNTIATENGRETILWTNVGFLADDSIVNAIWDILFAYCGANTHVKYILEVANEVWNFSFPASYLAQELFLTAPNPEAGGTGIPGAQAFLASRSNHITQLGKARAVVAGVDPALVLNFQPSHRQESSGGDYARATVDYCQTWGIPIDYLSLDGYLDITGDVWNLFWAWMPIADGGEATWSRAMGRRVMMSYFRAWCWFSAWFSSGILGNAQPLSWYKAGKSVANRGVGSATANTGLGKLCFYESATEFLLDSGDFVNPAAMEHDLVNDGIPQWVGDTGWGATETAYYAAMQGAAAMYAALMPTVSAPDLPSFTPGFSAQFASTYTPGGAGQMWFIYNWQGQQAGAGVNNVMGWAVSNPVAEDRRNESIRAWTLINWNEATMSTPTFREAVVAWLNSITALTDLIGDRIYYADPSQLSVYPCVVVYIPTREYQHNLSGSSGVSLATVHIEAISQSESQSQACMEAIRNNLDGFRGTKSGVSIGRCFLEDEYDAQTPPLAGGLTWIYHYATEYKIWHRVPLPTSVTQTNI